MSFDRGKTHQSVDMQDSELNDSMHALPTEEEAIRLMFGEERRGYLSRRRVGGFEHGPKLGEARMVP